MKKLLLSATLALTAICANAYDFEDKGIYYNVISEQESTVEITFAEDSIFEDNNSGIIYLKYPYNGNFAIPETASHNGKTYKVTTIGKKAFANCQSLESVSIPNTLINIEDSAFINCIMLSEIDIPNSVKSVGDYAFWGCACTKVNIGNSVETIGNSAFGICYLLNDLTIGSSVRTIGAEAFNQCLSLESVRIPDSVEDIGSMAFYQCNALSELKIGNSVKNIGRWAFFNCYALSDITWGNSVETIGELAFSYCRSLISANIPNSVKAIEAYAFAECTNLVSITIGRSIEYIGAVAFGGCNSLQAVCSLNPEPPVLTIDKDSIPWPGDLSLATLYVPQGSLAAYQGAEGWNVFGRMLELDPTAIDAAEAGGVEISATSGGIAISGAAEGLPVSVYDEGGRLAFSGTATGGTLHIPAAKGHIYIIKVGGKILKVAM